MTKDNTLGELEKNIFRVLNEYSVNGEEITDTQGLTGDLKKRLISSINRSIRKIVSFLVKPKSTVLLNLLCPDILIGPKNIKLSENMFCEVIPSDSSAFYFELTGSINLRIINNLTEEIIFQKEYSSPFGQAIPCRAFIPINDKVPMRIELEGQKGGYINNYTLYSSSVYPYSEMQEKSYKYILGPRWACAILPKGFYGIEKIENDNAEIVSSDLFKEKDGLIYCDCRLSGTYLLTYYYIPEPFDEESDKDSKIELPDIAIDALIYSAAADICPEENSELYSRLIYQYQDIVMNYYNTLNRGYSTRNKFYKQGKKRGLYRRGN